MKRYQSYKPSGVEWIGEIPEQWKIIRGKYIFSNIVDRNHPEQPLLSVTQKDSVVRRDELETRVWNPDSDISGYKLIKKGDFVISLRTFEGGIELSEIEGIVSPVYTVLRRKFVIGDRFYKYLLKSTNFITELNTITTGIRQGKNISYDDFSNILLPIPKYEEQLEIGRYLDKKTELIVKLISTKERKIILLKEQRISLINQVVTKGLNPNVKMKDSGVEWIGDIPEGWKYLPIKYTLINNKESIRTGPFGSSLKSDEFLDEGIRVYNQRSVYDEDFSKSDIFISEEKFEELKGFIVLPGDILITSRGTIGRMTIVPSDSEIGVLHPCLIRLRLNNELLISKYLWWYINHSSLFINSVKIESNSTTIEVIYSETLSSVRIPIPSYQEQHQIIQFLDSKTKEIDDMVLLEQKKIDLLKEYRQSLISEVVTGKIKVTE